MSEASTTPFSDKTEILSELWMDYREDEAFTELFNYGDLAFPLAYAIRENIVKATPLAEQYINEVWDIFLGELGLEDFGFETLDDLFTTSPNNPNA